MSNKLSISDIFHNAIHGKRWRVKNTVRIKPKYRRDAKGRFTGGFARKGYTRYVYDKTRPKVSNMELLTENVVRNNALLEMLRKRGIVAV